MQQLVNDNKYLTAEDITEGVIYALSTPPHVQVIYFFLFFTKYPILYDCLKTHLHTHNYHNVEKHGEYEKDTFSINILPKIPILQEHILSKIQEEKIN